MSYITADDIKSNLVRGVSLAAYLDDCDREIEDLAERKGVRDPSYIETDPLHIKIRDYAVAFVCMRVARDKLGTSGQDVSYDLYDREYDRYKLELKELFTQITYEMITGTVNSLTGRTSSFNLYRS